MASETEQQQDFGTGRLERIAKWDIDDRFGISALVSRSWKWLTDRQRLAWVLGIAIGITAIGVILALTGALGDAYRWVFERFGGRQFTYVMRDYPWVFGILAVAAIGAPFLLFKPESWKAAGLAYIVFWTGFLGGHVFWGSSGPGNSHCFNSEFEARVDPHNRTSAPQPGSGDHAVVFRVSVTPREGQARSSFAVDAGPIVAALRERVGPTSLDVEEFWIDDDPFVRAVVLRTSDGSGFPEGRYEGQVRVIDQSSGVTCEMREPYVIEVGG
ncbi:MAG: hypothetical protein QNJ81_08830 [Acidimicrobiia bacterium]|nr:hypothetical protein [Acidimicrobiia bacterium]